MALYQDYFKDDTMSLYEPMDENWQVALFFDHNKPELEEMLKTGQKLEDIFLNKIETLYPEFLENYLNIKERVLKFKEWLRAFVKDFKGKNLTLVGHSQFFNFL
jgi:hypothetical protein